MVTLRESRHALVKYKLLKEKRVPLAVVIMILVSVGLCSTKGCVRSPFVYPLAVGMDDALIYSHY